MQKPGESQLAIVGADVRRLKSEVRSLKSDLKLSQSLLTSAPTSIQ